MFQIVGYLGSQASVIRHIYFLFRPACGNDPSACNSLSRIKLRKFPIRYTENWVHRKFWGGKKEGRARIPGVGGVEPREGIPLSPRRAFTCWRGQISTSISSRRHDDCSRWQPSLAQADCRYAWYYHPDQR